MYEFLDRLVTVAIPRIRDFRGLNPNNFDKHGNYNLGISDQLVFPEIDYESDNVLKQQRLGAIAINELVVRFSKNESVDDYELLALVLVRFKDILLKTDSQ